MPLFLSWNFGFQYKGHRIYPESRDSQFKPITYYPVHLCPHLRIVHVQIRLKIIKPMKVIGFGISFIGPGCFLYTGKYHALIRISWLFIRPDIPVPMLCFFAAAGIQKPWMLVRSMVDDQVDDHLYPSFSCLMHKFHEITTGTMAFIYTVIIPDVISIVPVS